MIGLCYLIVLCYTTLDWSMLSDCFMLHSLDWSMLSNCFMLHSLDSCTFLAESHFPSGLLFIDVYPDVREIQMFAQLC